MVDALELPKQKRAVPSISAVTSPQDVPTIDGICTRKIIFIDEVGTFLSKMFRYRSGVIGHDAIFMESDLNIDSKPRPHQKPNTSPT